MARCAGPDGGCPGRDGSVAAIVGGRRGLELDLGLKTGGGRQGFDFFASHGNRLPPRPVRDLGKGESPTAASGGRLVSGGIGEGWLDLHCSTPSRRPSPCFVASRSSNSGRALLRGVRCRLLPRRPASRRWCPAGRRAAGRSPASAAAWPLVTANTCNPCSKDIFPRFSIPTCFRRRPKPARTYDLHCHLHTSPQRRCPAHASARRN